MTSGLVNASFSLPEGQAVKMIFFAPCNYTCRNSRVTVRKFPLQSVLYLGERGEEIEQAKLTKYHIIIIIFSYLLSQIYYTAD